MDAVPLVVITMLLLECCSECGDEPFVLLGPVRIDACKRLYRSDAVKRSNLGALDVMYVRLYFTLCHKRS